MLPLQTEKITIVTKKKYNSNGVASTAYYFPILIFLEQVSRDRIAHMRTKDILLTFVVANEQQVLQGWFRAEDDQAGSQFDLGCVTHGQ
jgi:hypothetical protein